MTSRCPFCAEEIQPEAVKCKHCLTWLPGGTKRAAELAFGGMSPSKEKGMPLRRPREGRVVAGVCAGFARNIGVDAVWVRLGFVLTAFVTVLFPCLILYIVCAFVIPADDNLHLEV